jgi:hypothetical protein
VRLPIALLGAALLIVGCEAAPLTVTPDCHATILHARVSGWPRLRTVVLAIDPSFGEFRLSTDDVPTRAVIVGMTGSGKTGLVTVMVEEALRAGCPRARRRREGAGAEGSRSSPRADDTCQ